MMKYKGQGGTAPRETTIAGQRHMLAYINPFEYDLLQQYNAAPNVYGPGGIPAYPGNAAAEGGFGLGAGDAFGGGVSSAGGGSAGSSASPSEGPGAGAVGGAQGGNSSGGGEGPGGYDAFGNGYATAAEAAAADAAAAAAAAGANVSASASFGGGYASPSTGRGGVGSGPASMGGLLSGATNTSANMSDIGSYLSGVTTPDTVYSGRSVPGNINADTIANTPAIAPGYSMSVAPQGLPSISMDTAPTSTSETSTPGLTESDMFAIDEAVLDALAEDTTPSLASSNVSTNVSPAAIAEDTATTSTGTTPSPLGRVGQIFSNAKNDLAMGMIALGKNRADAADAMFAKGYTAQEIGDFFGRTDATVAANEAAAENAIGAGDRLAMDLDPCPAGFVLDPNTKVCVVDTSGMGGGGGSDAADETADGTPARTPVLPEMPTSLPGQSGFSPYTIPGMGPATAVGLQPYPGMTGGAGGLAAMPSPNQAGIMQMAPMQMQPAPPPPPLITTPVRPQPAAAAAQAPADASSPLSNPAFLNLVTKSLGRTMGSM